MDPPITTDTASAVTDAVEPVVDKLKLDAKPTVVVKPTGGTDATPPEPPNKRGNWPYEIALAVALMVVAVVLWTQHPPIGTFIAIVGVVAVFVTVWPLQGRAGKFLWILVFVLLGYLEIKNLYRDQADHDKKERQTRAEEREQFNQIGNQLKTAITNAQNGFNDTLQRMEDLSKLSKRNVDAVTGGDGFVYFDISQMFNDPNGVALVALVHGPNTMRQVAYEITVGRPPYLPQQGEIDDIIAGRRPYVSLGDLAHDRAHPVGRTLHPSVQNDGYFNINILALNGSINEKLEVRRESNGRWNRRITVTTVKHGKDEVIFRSDWAKQPKSKAQAH